MKRIIFIGMVTVSSLQITSCEVKTNIMEEDSSVVSFDTKGFVERAAAAGLNESDLASFAFEIIDSKGIVYSGPFSEGPGMVTVHSGECSFKLQSREYSGPEFDNPIFGDKVVMDVSAGDEFEVNLSCRQLTSGVQILFANEFKEAFPEGFVRITCRDTAAGGVEYVDYHTGDTGFCHFLPGLVTVNLMKDAGSYPELLTGRYCCESDMFSVTVKMASTEACGTVTVEVDTVLVRAGETYNYGRKRMGKTIFDAIDVSDISSFAGDTVWVAGYISGCYVDKKWHCGADADAVTTNISLSPSMSSESACPVGISTGKCKALNLKEYPQFFGERVAIFGVAGKLYDLDAVKKALDYVLL